MRQAIIFTLFAVSAIAQQNKTASTAEVKLAYGCVTDGETTYFQYTIENTGARPVQDVNVDYWYQFQKDKRAISEEMHYRLNSRRQTAYYLGELAPNASVTKREEIFRFSRNVPLDFCIARIEAFQHSTKKTVYGKEQTGRRPKVAPDCQADYAKYLRMPAGLEKRKFHAQLVLWGCIGYEPVFSTTKKVVDEWQTVSGELTPEFIAQGQIVKRREEEKEAELKKRMGTLRPVPEGVSYQIDDPGTPPAVLEQVEAEYPEAALAAKIQGIVTLSVQISTNGVADDVSVVSGDARLVPAAIEAVKKWRFRPATSRSGKVIPWRSTIEFRFSSKF